MPNERLLPRGTQRLHGERAINPTDSVESAARRAQDLNTKENLLSFFTEGQGRQHVLFTVTLPSGDVVAQVVPTAPYAPGGFMVCADNPRTLETEGSNKARYIYDFPPVTQIMYWKLTVANILAMEEEANDGKDAIVMATENTMIRTSFDKRSSRTLDFPHGQINRYVKDGITPGEVEVPNLKLEQRVLSYAESLSEFGDRIVHSLGNDTGILDSVAVRREEPFGYTMRFNATRGNAIERIHEFQKAMHIHHQTYAEEARKKLSQNHLSIRTRNRIITQPSYRTYLYFKDGQLHAAISPEILSHAGVTEAAGVKSERTPDAVSHFRADELQSFQERVKDRVLQKAGLVEAGNQ